MRPLGAAVRMTYRRGGDDGLSPSRRRGPLARRLHRLEARQRLLLGGESGEDLLHVSELTLQPRFLGLEQPVQRLDAVLELLGAAVQRLARPRDDPVLRV